MLRNCSYSKNIDRLLVRTALGRPSCTSFGQASLASSIFQAQPTVPIFHYKKPSALDPWYLKKGPLPYDPDLWNISYVYLRTYNLCLSSEILLYSPPLQMTRLTETCDLTFSTAAALIIELFWEVSLTHTLFCFIFPVKNLICHHFLI